MSDAPNLILPFVVWPGASVAERTQLLELWANVILKTGWEAAQAAAPKPFTSLGNGVPAVTGGRGTKTGTSWFSGVMTGAGRRACSVTVGTLSI